jgi:hypothetical protein
MDLDALSGVIGYKHTGEGVTTVTAAVDRINIKYCRPPSLALARPILIKINESLYNVIETPSLRSAILR